MLHSPSPDPAALLQTDPDHWTGEERREYAAAMCRGPGTIGPAIVAEIPVAPCPTAAPAVVPVMQVTARDPLLGDMDDLALTGATVDSPHAYSSTPPFLRVAELSLRALLPAAVEDARLRAELAHAWYELDRMADVLFTGLPQPAARSTSRPRDRPSRAAGRPGSRR
jgi:hypothetical protein